VGCPADAAALGPYLRAHIIRPAAYHVGNTNRALDQIRYESKLRQDIEAILDASPVAHQSPKAARDVILEGLRRTGGGGRVAPMPTIDPGPQRKAWIHLVVLILAVLLLLPLILIFGGLALLILQYQESREPVHGGVPDSDRVRSLETKEDWVVQNHISSAYTVKAGALRRLALRVVLFVINALARTIFTHGTLGGITSIHFAHWALLDGGRTLIFYSNFDGSWRSYLDDFIDKASVGLSGVWSNTKLFPRTWFLIFGGARDGPRFKAWARDHQFITRVWYTAYPDLTVAQIDKNTKIHAGMDALLDGAALQAWLYLL
jgi:hypothetical protein